MSRGRISGLIQVLRLPAQKIFFNGNAAPLRNIFKTAFSHYLLLTNVTISMTLSGTGDVVQQKYKMASGQQQHFSISRTTHLTATGLTVGALCHYWYQTLDRLLPGQGIKVVLKKLAVDQILFSPVCISVFFVTLAVSKKCLSALTGCPTTSLASSDTRSSSSDASKPTSELEAFIHDFKHKGAVLYLSEWLVWPPAQMVNFYFLPTRYRVLYDNCVSFVYDVYTSHICYDVGVEDIQRLAADTEQLFTAAHSSHGDKMADIGVQALMQSSAISNTGAINDSPSNHLAI